MSAGAGKRAAPPAKPPARYVRGGLDGRALWPATMQPMTSMSSANATG